MHQHAAGHRLEDDPFGARIGQAAGEQEPQILLVADDADRFFAGVGRDDDLGENLDDGARRLRIERPVQRDDPAERRDRVTGERLLVGVEQRAAFGDAARIRVLHDNNGHRALGVELGDALVGRVGVVDVVVGKLLALQLARSGHAEAPVHSRVERRFLVRVLAVSQFFHELAAEGAPGGRALAGLDCEPVRDRRVVGGGARIGLGGEAAAERERGAAACLDLFQHFGVVRRVDHDRHVIVVLRRRAHQCRTADVDILDAVGKRRILQERLLERIEIHHHEVDRLDRVLAQRSLVARVVADRENAAMHFRMQRLHPAAHHLGKAGEFGDFQHLEARVEEGFPCAAGRDQDHAAARKSAGEFG